MTDTANTSESNLRNVRMLHLLMLLSMIIYTGVVLSMVHPSPGPINPAFFWSVVGVATGVFFAALVIQAKRVQPAMAALRSQPDDANAWKKLRVGTILSSVMLECVVLFGLSLYIQGASQKQITLFFVLPICLMLFWFPKRP